MNTLAPSTLMRPLETRDDLCSPRPRDRLVVKVLRRAWCKISEVVKAERPHRPDPYESPVGLFILGYGKVPGTQESGRRYR